MNIYLTQFPSPDETEGMDELKQEHVFNMIAHGYFRESDYCDIESIMSEEQGLNMFYKQMATSMREAYCQILADAGKSRLPLICPQEEDLHYSSIVGSSNFSPQNELEKIYDENLDQQHAHMLKGFKVRGIFGFRSRINCHIFDGLPHLPKQGLDYLSLKAFLETRTSIGKYNAKIEAAVRSGEIPMH